MKSSLFIAFSGALVLVLSSHVWAQVGSEAQDAAALEAARAASIAARGQYNYNTGAGAVEGEAARSTALDTSARALREYYVRKQVNADYLVRRGAALRLDDAALGTELAPAVRRLLDDPAALEAMRAAARAAATPQAAQRLAAELAGLAAGRERPGRPA